MAISLSVLNQDIKDINNIIKDRKLVLQAGYGKYQILLANESNEIITALTGMRTKRDIHEWLWAYRTGLRHAFTYAERIKKGGK